MNRAFESARRKGAQAYLDGMNISDCPYHDKMVGRRFNVISYSRAFRNAWADGFIEERRKHGIAAKAEDQGRDPLSEGIDE
jgi:hypothetical protein